MWGICIRAYRRRGRTRAVVMLNKKRAVVCKHPVIAKIRLRKSSMGRIERCGLLDRTLPWIRPLLPAVSRVVPASLLLTGMVHNLSSRRRVLLGGRLWRRLSIYRTRVWRLGTAVVTVKVAPRSWGMIGWGRRRHWCLLLRRRCVRGSLNRLLSLRFLRHIVQQRQQTGLLRFCSRLWRRRRWCRRLRSWLCRPRIY